MKKPIFGAHAAVALLVGTLLAVPAPAQATYHNCEVTTPDDVVDAGDGETSLRECLEETALSSGDVLTVTFASDITIELDEPIVALPGGNATINLTGPATVTASDAFTPVGESGYLIEVLDDEPGVTHDVFVDGVSFIDAPYGFLYVVGDLDITESTFLGADGDSAVIAANVAVRNSFFSNNTSEAGGAIWADGTVDVSSSYFERNQATEGGAIYAQDAKIRGSHFQENLAFAGGAVFVSDYVSSDRSSFIGNEALFDGGAIYADEEAFASFSTFYQNTAGGVGGAVWTEDHFYSGFNSIIDNSADDYTAVYADDDDLVSIGTVFASPSNSSDLIYFEEMSYDFGGNVLTSSEDIFDSDSSQISASFADLALGELLEFSNGTFGLVPSSGSILGDRVTESDVEDFVMYVEADRADDSFWNLSMEIDQYGNVPTAPFSSGSVDFLAQLQPVPYTGPVVTNDPETAGSGSTVTYLGSDLDSVISATIGGQSATVISKSDATLTLRVPTGLAQGMHDVVLKYSTTEHITLQNGFILQDAMKVWTKLQSDNTVKMYAKNIIGEGKIQFFHNGSEIAWIRATDSLNPKLSFANGSHYLVRTRELVAGKNAFEIYDDGIRIWRAAYSK